jgi:hypothetical protein
MEKGRSNIEDRNTLFKLNPYIETPALANRRYFTAINNN